MKVMKPAKAILILGALCLGISSSALAAAEKAHPAQPAQPATPAVPAQPWDGMKTAQPAAPATLAVPPSGLPGELDSVRGDLMTPPAKPNIADEIKKAVEDAKKARAEFLKEQQELRRGLPEVSKEARAKIREDLQKAREDFIVKQRQDRADFKRKVAEMKENLKQHEEAIDEAKDEAKDKTRIRKDG